jgi:hypothetical protein
MSRRSLLLRGIRILSIISIFYGFTRLSWGVTREYFEYKTVSHIAIHDYQEDGIRPPAIVICFRFANWRINLTTKINQIFTGEENYLNDRNDSWIVQGIEARISHQEKERHESMKFIIGNRYCMLVKVLNQFKMEQMTSTRFGGISRFFVLNLSMTPAHSSFTYGFGFKRCIPKFINFILVRDESTISNPRNRELGKATCTRGIPRYDMLLTYSSFVNVRLSPPYDTNCLNYPKEGPFLSSYDCYDACLKKSTKKWNVVPGMTVIDRKKYLQSDAYIGYPHIIENEDQLTRVSTDDSLPKTIREIYSAVHSEWNGIRETCHQSCYRPDCRSEDTSPEITQFAGFDSASSEKGIRNESSLSSLRILMLISHQPTLEVSTVPKQRLVDYFIYMSSMLSFWLGFCPLTIMERIIQRLQKYTTRNKVAGKWDQRFRWQDESRIERLEKELVRVNELLETMCPNQKSYGNRPLSPYECTRHAKR